MFIEDDIHVHMYGLHQTFIMHLPYIDWAGPKPSHSRHCPVLRSILTPTTENSQFSNNNSEKLFFKGLALCRGVVLVVSVTPP